MHLKLDYRHPTSFQVFPTKAFTSVPSFALSSVPFLSPLRFWGPFSSLNYSLGEHLPCSRTVQPDNLLLIVLRNHGLLLSPSQWLTASITASIQHLQPNLSLFLLFLRSVILSLLFTWGTLLLLWVRDQLKGITTMEVSNPRLSCYGPAGQVLRRNWDSSFPCDAAHYVWCPHLRCFQGRDLGLTGSRANICLHTKAGVWLWQGLRIPTGDVAHNLQPSEKPKLLSGLLYQTRCGTRCDPCNELL